LTKGVRKEPLPKFLFCWVEEPAASLAEPVKAAVKIGSGTWPESPVSAKVGADAQEGFDWQTCRLFSAFLNSQRKPFSKIFTSFRFWFCHRPTA
jgi:hypothetical protein